MDLGIAGKVAVITASSAGLGKAVAHALAAEGVKLVLFARSAELLRQTAAVIEQRHNVPVLAVAGDMRSPADVDRLIFDTQQKFGSPDILILNTGRPPRALRRVLEETDDERWEDAYQTQLRAAVLVASRIVPLIVERGWGRVIAITSASVKQPMLHHGLSTVFRAGVTAYMKHLANEIAAQGVTVNTVGPGSIDTPTPRTSEHMAERLRRVPIGRLGQPEELAAMVAFLASNQAGFITGANLHVDGGMVAALN
jgi:3-oxoacyl-[acyl-carrier protein] reductase